LKPISGKSKQVQTREAAGVPVVADFEQYAGDGGEGITPHDLPRAALKIAHKMSDVCEKRSDKWIEGLEPGMIYNASTREFWPAVDEDGAEGVLIIPVKYVNHVIEWQPNRGGFVGEHPPGAPITEGAEWIEDTQGKRHWVAENGNELVDTASFYCFLIKSDNTHEEVIIDMASTQWETAKNFNAFMKSRKRPSSKNPAKSFKMPFYSSVYRMFTRYKSNDEGDWYVWKFEHRGELKLDKAPQLTLFEAAVKYKALIDKGEVEVERDQD